MNDVRERAAVALARIAVSAAVRALAQTLGVSVGEINAMLTRRDPATLAHLRATLAGIRPRSPVAPRRGSRRNLRRKVPR